MSALEPDRLSGSAAFRPLERSVYRPARERPEGRAPMDRFAACLGDFFVAHGRHELERGSATRRQRNGFFQPAWPKTGAPVDRFKARSNPNSLSRV